MLETLDRLITPVRIVVVLAMAASLGNGIAGFIRIGADSTTDITGTESGAIAGPAADAATGSTDVSALTALNLYGPLAAPNAAPVQQQIAETRLRLTLQGVILADDAAASAALIQEPNRPGTIYTVGASLPGNARLKAVHADHVILSRGGRDEKLSFPDNPARRGFASGDETANAGSTAPARVARRPPTGDSTAAPSATSTTSGQDSLDPAQLRALARATARPTQAETATLRPLERDRERAGTAGRQIPDGTPDGVRELLASMGSGSDEAAMAGAGLQVLPSGAIELTAAASDLMAQTGLQPGDQVLSVNGLPMATVRNNPGAMESMLESPTARVEIQRGERRLTFNVKLQ